MPRPFGTLSRGARRQEVAHQRAREEAMAGIDRTYKLLEVYPQMRIEPTQHVTLGVRCEPFALNEDPDDPRSSDSPTGEPTFFLPRRVPEVDIDSPGCEQEVNYLSQYWGDDKSIQTSSSLTVQSWDLWSRIEKMFVLFRRQEEPPLDEGYKRSLCRIAEWRPSGGIVSSLIADKFKPKILSSRRWSPITGYVSRKQSLTTKNTLPHVLIAIVVEEEPSDYLLRAELITITAVMITRLEGGQFPECSTIPVLAMTVFGQMKFRFLQAFYGQQGLVIRKTELFDFSTNEEATRNMNTVLGIMASHQVGDPTDPRLICQPTQSVESTAGTVTRVLKGGVSLVSQEFKSLSIRGRSRGKGRPPIPDYET